MNNYNPNIHHRKSIRLKGYDYSQAGLYFITICCDDRKHLFGEITDGEMEMNENGTIAYNEWMNTPEIPKNIELGEFIVMPNHIHGIINITRRGELHSPNIITDDNDTHQMDGHQMDGRQMDGRIQYAPTGIGRINTGEFNSPQQTIGSIVRGFKSSVTKQINLLGGNIKGEFNSPQPPKPPQQVWQRNYYEHIIRDEKAYNNISNYIINNPSRWKEDKFNS